VGRAHGRLREQRAAAEFGDAAGVLAGRGLGNAAACGRSEWFTETAFEIGKAGDQGQIDLVVPAGGLRIVEVSER
jgi:hypothetical protein